MRVMVSVADLGGALGHRCSRPFEPLTVPALGPGRATGDGFTSWSAAQRPADKTLWVAAVAAHEEWLNRLGERSAEHGGIDWTAALEDEIVTTTIPRPHPYATVEIDLIDVPDLLPRFAGLTP